MHAHFSDAFLAGAMAREPRRRRQPVGRGGFLQGAVSALDYCSGGQIMALKQETRGELGLAEAYEAALPDELLDEENWAEQVGAAGSGGCTRC